MGLLQFYTGHYVLWQLLNLSQLQELIIVLSSGFTPDAESIMDSFHGAKGQQDDNYAVFRDCLSAILLQTAVSGNESSTKRPGRRRRTKKKNTPVPSHVPDSRLQNDADDDLSDFIEYLAATIFDAFPDPLKQLNHRSWRESPDLQTQFALPLTPETLSTLDLPLSIPDTLATYNLISADPALDSSSLPATTEHFLLPVMTSYIETLTTPPPASWTSRTDACEMCDRDWIPLSYHHLIPRFVHDKVVKRGWHRREDLQNVAWLCGACHGFVHRFKTHEELAREYYTMDRLLAEEEVRKFAAWVGRLGRRGGGR
ncbi:hypothetical protein E4U55_005551 [Claviceps digitariae]|nr:hypothetical protein E4U55_005551 [Claviceps digitariae]